MTNQQAKALLRKYAKGKCTASEIALLDAWFLQLNKTAPDLSAEKAILIGKKIYRELPQPKQTQTVKLWTLAATVAAASLIALAIWMFQAPVNKDNKIEVVQDVKPGGYRATLHFSNGKTLVLSPTQQGIVIKKDLLTYADGSKVSNDKLTDAQTVTTPIGGQYQITLPDGTKVWLNSATTLQYTTTRNRENSERRVRLVAGEAYFEVAKDKKHPFIVSTADQEIKVLGTHFNVNVYTPVLGTKTTLLEGSVRVTLSKNANSKIMVPGQQAITSGGRISTKTVDTELEIAWTRGKTEFEGADLNTVMGMLERWYGIETIYQTTNTESRFTGTVSRNRNISAVLKLLESTGEVHFKIEGRKVTVMK